MEVKKNLSDIWKEEDPNHKFPQFYPGRSMGRQEKGIRAGPQAIF
jgi:hypothetical protein